MTEYEQLQKGIGQILKDLRIKRGLSKAKMADYLYMDGKTWSRWEEGETAPTVPEFLWIFRQLKEDALRPVLNIVYPSTYNGLNPGSDIDSLRNAAAHYFSHTASEQTVREWDFLVLGHHGSNIEPQMQEFTMINHLPLEYRVAIASMVLTFWRLASERGEIIKNDYVMPDIDLFLEGFENAQKAAFEGLNSYSTGMR